MAAHPSELPHATIDDVSADRTRARKASHFDLRRRLVARMHDKSTDLSEGPQFIDPSVYTDPERFRIERRELFQHRPILAALSRDLPEPGDTFLFDEVGPAILLTRNREGVVRAFLNMCMHRAAKLVPQCGRKNRMSCKFHGWTFDLDGKLVGIPGKAGFDGIEPATRNLIPVPVAEWNGLIFVRAVPNGEPIDVEAHLGPFASELAHLELEKATPMKSTRIDVQANWKYALDTYGEGYHFATLHPQSIGALALSNIMCFRPYGANFRLGMPRAEFLDYADKPESEWPDTNYGGLYFIFPNVMINVNSMKGGEQFYGISRLFPGDAVNRATTLITTYKPGHMPDDADPELWRAMHDFIHTVVSTEDYSVSADGQRNMEYAPPGFQSILGANELALQHMHREFSKIVDAGA